ncbi:MAG: helix-turn-helix domain-containing protein [Bacteroidota bacterium]|nr:helix-turn-helix domain-containing protein [Bacteroidota bacterium]
MTPQRIIVIEGDELERIVEKCFQNQVQVLMNLVEKLSNNLIDENQKTSEMGDLINTDTVAKILQCSRPSVYKLRKLKLISPVIILGRVFYKKSDVMQLINRSFN